MEKTCLSHLHKPPELSQGQTLYADSTDYLMGGILTLRNGRIDKYLFSEGYCQAERQNNALDGFTFYYYNRDHLGNNREVIDSEGNVLQRTDYYPYGTPFSAPSDGLNATLQPYKYNGKELDKMHGLNTYDYGARQYYSILGRWDRIDPLCEKYYSLSPYNYCGNNPMFFVDPNGKEPIYDRLGNRLGITNDGFLGETGMLYVYLGKEKDIDWGRYSRAELKKTFVDDIQNADHYVKSEDLHSREKGIFLSNIATDIVKEYDHHKIEYEGQTYTFDFSKYGNIIPYKKGTGNFYTSRSNSKTEWSISIGDCYESYDLNGFNILGSYLYHEWFGHVIMGWGDETRTHHKCFEMVINSIFFDEKRHSYYIYINNMYNQYKEDEK